MAGSVAHTMTGEGCDEFTMDLLDNMGDAHEALEEYFALVWLMARRIGEFRGVEPLIVINEFLDELGFIRAEVEYGDES